MRKFIIKPQANNVLAIISFKKKYAEYTEDHNASNPSSSVHWFYQSYLIRKTKSDLSFTDIRTQEVKEVNTLLFNLASIYSQEDIDKGLELYVVANAEELNKALDKLFDPTTMTDPQRLRYITALKNGCHILSVNTPDYLSGDSDYSDYSDDDHTYSFGHQIVQYKEPYNFDRWIKDVWSISQSDILFVGEIHKRKN